MDGWVKREKATYKNLRKLGVSHCIMVSVILRLVNLLAFKAEERNRIWFCLGKKGGNSVEEKILEAFNETYNGGFKSFEEIKKGYDTTEILDTWLEYEGIVGYTRDIIDLLGACDVFIEE